MKQTKRLADKLNQVVYLSLKDIRQKSVERVYSHNDGSLTGSVVINKNKDRVMLKFNPNNRVWEMVC